jgi:hypothetical protein
VPNANMQGGRSWQMTILTHPAYLLGGLYNHVSNVIQWCVQMNKALEAPHIRPLKKKVGDRPRAPHEKGPAPKQIIFFIFQKNVLTSTIMAL